MALQDAQVINVKGNAFLVWTDDEPGTKQPTLLFIRISTVQPEDYDEVYGKYLDKLYEN